MSRDRNSRKTSSVCKQKTMINKLKKYFKILLPTIIFLFAQSAQAVCPVCVVAVSGCVGLSRYLGVDDSISGLWIGGLLISVIIWTIDWLKRKNIKFYGRKILVTVLFYVFTVGPLYKSEFIGHPMNEIWGIDKLLLGIIFGSVFFLLAVFANDFLKKKNGGKVFFPFQKVVVPIVMLGILSGVFYFLTC